MSLEVMKQALEALKEINKLSIGESAICLPAEIDTAMDALRQAIGQAEQDPIGDAQDRLIAEQAQPVAWMYVNKDGECEQIEFGPVPNDPEVTPLYTAPPKKEWEGLTEAERVDIIDIEITQPNDDHFALAQSIEATLKEKNT
jgi:hypothetical protein